jgi:hypothetical protein
MGYRNIAYIKTIIFKQREYFVTFWFPVQNSHLSLFLPCEVVAPLRESPQAFGLHKFQALP